MRNKCSKRPSKKAVPFCHPNGNNAPLRCGYPNINYNLRCCRTLRTQLHGSNLRVSLVINPVLPGFHCPITELVFFFSKYQSYLRRLRFATSQLLYRRFTSSRLRVYKWGSRSINGGVHCCGRSLKQRRCGSSRVRYSSLIFSCIGLPVSLI